MDEGWLAKTRACVKAATLRQAEKIMPGQKILEVGFGIDRICRRAVWRRQGEWFGIDPKRAGGHRANTWEATASDMPCEDETFDGCFALETMEHWREHGDEPMDGLAEIHRVLKPGAWLLVTVPIHMHGAMEFVIGAIPMILGYFDPELWEIEVEHWRKNPSPLPTFKGWRRFHDQLIQERNPRPNLSTWSLAITARKISGPGATPSTGSGGVTATNG